MAWYNFLRRNTEDAFAAPAGTGQSRIEAAKEARKAAKESLRATKEEALELLQEARNSWRETKTIRNIEEKTATLVAKEEKLIKAAEHAAENIAESGRLASTAKVVGDGISAGAKATGRGISASAEAVTKTVFAPAKLVGKGAAGTVKKSVGSVKNAYGSIAENGLRATISNKISNNPWKTALVAAVAIPTAIWTTKKALDSSYKNKTTPPEFDQMRAQLAETEAVQNELLMNEMMKQQSAVAQPPMDPRMMQAGTGAQISDFQNMGGVHSSMDPSMAQSARG